MFGVKWVCFLAADALLFAALYVFLSRKPEQFELFMMSAAPAVFLMVAALFLYALFCLRRKIMDTCRALYPVLPHLLVLLAIGYGALFGLTKNYKHLIWYDEDIYEAQACNTASRFQSRICGYAVHEGRELVCTDGPYNKEPIGYTTFLAVFYKVFGCSERFNFLFQALVFFLLVVSVTGIAFMLWNNPFQAVCAAGLVSLLYPVLLWFRTMAIEPTAMVMACIAVCACLVAYRNPGDRAATLLCLSALTLSSMIRPEGGLIWGLYLGGGLLLFTDKKAFLAKAAQLLPLIFLLMMLQLLHFLMFAHFTWGNDAGGEKFLLSVIPENLKANVLYFCNNRNIPVLLTGCAAFGFLPFCGRGRLSEKLFLLLWFIVFFLVFIPFYAGSYEYGMDSRYVLLCIAPVAVLASLALAKIPKTLAVIALLLMTVTYFPLLQKNVDSVWDCYADHRYGEMLLHDVEPDALVVTPNPQMTMMIGVNTLYDGQLDQYIQDKPQEIRRFSKIYFYYSFWCNAAPREGRTRSYCFDAIEKYNGRLINRYELGHYEYALYELTVPRR